MKPAKRNNPAVLLLSFSVLFSTCTSKKIPEDVLVKVYVENTVAYETYSSNADSLKAHSNLIFNKYKISEKDFEAELQKYSDDKTKWEDFFKQANNYLNDLKKKNKIN